MATQEQLEAIAHHEAGHAVACHVRGLSFGTVTIRERDVPGKWAVGGVSFDPPRHSDIAGLNTRLIDSTMIVLCAGPLAEARHLGHENPLAFLRTAHLGAAEKLNWRDRISNDLDNDWDLVLEIARKVSDTHGVAVERVLAHAEEQAVGARKLIDDDWPAVEAVATALLEQGTLTAEQVLSVLAGAQIDRPEPPR